MNTINLIIKEISHRKITFFIALSSTILSVAIIIGSITALDIFNINTEKVIATKETETKQRMEKLEDDYRKIMKKMGFNLVILPKNQDISKFYLENYSRTYFPENYCNLLAESSIMTIRHILPILQEPVFWQEMKMSVILSGTKGEVPILNRSLKQPILRKVENNEIILGYTLHEGKNIQEGSSITLLNEQFTVLKCNEQRGTKDDITAWINLKKAQKLLNKPEKINAILALQCHCHGLDIQQIKNDITHILPDVQVIEKGTKIIARAEARHRAAEEAHLSILAEKSYRQNISLEKRNHIMLIIPLIIFISFLLLSLLFFKNAWSRKIEFGIFSAMGINLTKVYSLFLLKAIIIGISGAIIGYLVGILIPIIKYSELNYFDYFDIKYFFLTIIVTSFISLLTAWIPTLIITQQDPAQILQKRE